MDLPVPALICLCVFCAAAAVHLARCLQGSPKSAYTKPLLVSSLTLFYAFAAPRPAPALIAALAASWLGDVLLMPSGNGWFTAGGISFLLGHVSFIFVYLPHIVPADAAWGIVAPAAILYAAAAAFVTARIRRAAPAPLLVPMALYLAANAVMNLFALLMLTCAPSVGAALAYVGALLFFASDSILFLARYDEKKDRIPKSGFLIMLTYILGEALITFGMLAVGPAQG